LVDTQLRLPYTSILENGFSGFTGQLMGGMTMPKACNLKKGNIVQLDGHPYQVKKIEVQTPSARGANTLYKVRLSQIPSGQKLDKTYKGNDMLEEITMERRPVSFIFREQEMYTFMDSENYEQYTLSSGSMEDQIQWLSEGLEGIMALLIEGQIIAVELPASVQLEIIEAAPVMKGASVTNRTKPATLTNGLQVQVPEYLSPGDRIQVNTETGEFMSRVK
jgi:elongation factor P